MSFQEKRSLSSFISTVLGFTIYYLYVYQLYIERTMDLSEEIKFWAAVFLILVPVMIVFKIIIHIIFVIIIKIRRDEDYTELEDEFDKIIELKSERISQIVFMLGLFFSMGVIVLDYSVTVMFNMIIFSGMIGGSIADLVQIYFYRRGV